MLAVMTLHLLCSWPIITMVLVICVSSLGALNSSELMLPGDVLRKQGRCSSTHPPEGFVVTHLCKGLVLPRWLPGPFVCTHCFQVNFGASVVCFSLLVLPSLGGKRLDEPAAPLSARARSRRCCRCVAVNESELFRKLQGGQLCLTETSPIQASPLRLPQNNEWHVNRS